MRIIIYSDYNGFWAGSNVLRLRTEKGGRKTMTKYSKYLSLKSSIENLFGTQAWYDLKESDSVSIWRKYITKTLKALRISIHETVEICDKKWISDADRYIDDGLNILKGLNTIDELISCLAATALNLSFLQTGFMPSRRGEERSISLRKKNWRHNHYRQVVYLQVPKQRENLFWGEQQRKLGFQEQMKLYEQYRRSDSKIPYSEWCQTLELHQIE
jgi:hypothetical protein